MSPQVALANFHRYVQENITRISALYREIEEIQYRFNDIYGKLQTQWQESVEKTAPQLQQAELPPQQAEMLRGYQQQERQKLEERISQLRQQVAEKQQAAEAALREAQAELQRVREFNPVLNEREEALKARSRSETEAIAAVEQQIKSAGLGARLFGNHERRKELERLRQQHAETLQQLKAVREEWQAKKQELAERQDTLRAAWEKASIELAQIKSELDYLEPNVATLAAQRGAQRMLAELQEAPAGRGPLYDAMADIAQMNQQLAQYREGITRVAEALGVLTGIRSGMERFAQSVAKLYEEQERYNLQPLKVDVPRRVIEFHNIWAEFRGKVKDEKHLGAHPLEFSKVAADYVQKRLTEEAIKDMFEQMGEALSAAAKAWE